MKAIDMIYEGGIYHFRAPGTPNYCPKTTHSAIYNSIYLVIGTNKYQAVILDVAVACKNRNDRDSEVKFITMNEKRNRESTSDKFMFSFRHSKNLF